MINRRFALLAGVAFLVSTIAFELPTDAKGGGGEVRLIAFLGGSPTQPLASGKAVYRKRDTSVRLSVEVEDLRGVRRVNVSVGGVNVGSARVAAGTADLNLSGGAVPAVTTGTVVQVFDARTGQVVAEGTF